MKRDLVFHREYAHPPERVWRALTDPEALGEWMMENDFMPEVGHRFTFRTDPKPGFDGITHCEVLEVDPEKTLVFTFTGGGLDTVVRYSLEPTETGTRLMVEHTGFRGLRAYLISFLMQMGIRGMYDRQLPALLQKMADS